jgi:hypothetical protein
MKCLLCDKRKAKRFCPAKNSLICTQCCGEKRVLEIDCPETCDYLKSGREREAADYGKRLRGMDGSTRERSLRVLTDYANVVSHLEYTLSRERLQSRDLVDAEVAAALDILLDNYRTEDRGVLYDKTSEDLRVDYLRRELKKVIELHRNPEGDGNNGIIDPKAARLPLSAAIECLEFIRSVIATYLEERHSVTGYVDFLARATPRDDNSSSIIMP